MRYVIFEFGIYCIIELCKLKISMILFVSNSVEVYYVNHILLSHITNCNEDQID